MANSNSKLKGAHTSLTLDEVDEINKRLTQVKGICEVVSELDARESFEHGTHGACVRDVLWCARDQLDFIKDLIAGGARQ